MHPGRIEGATRTLGAPQNWEKERHGPCGGLPIRDVVLPDSGLNAMGSVWFPTPEEIAALVEGAPIQLWVLGSTHPVVALMVGKTPCDP